MAKRKSKRVVRKKVSLRGKLVDPTRRKDIVLKNLFLFLILFIVSVLLYIVSAEEMYVNLFFLLSVLFGFLVIALLIVFLVITFMRYIRK